MTDTVIGNDFVTFFTQHSSVERVCFNGKEAEHLYARLVLPTLPSATCAVTYFSLPSTSPANAAIPWAAKVSAWKAAIM